METYNKHTVTLTNTTKCDQYTQQVWDNNWRCKNTKVRNRCDSQTQVWDNNWRCKNTKPIVLPHPNATNKHNNKKKINNNKHNNKKPKLERKK